MGRYTSVQTFTNKDEKLEPSQSVPGDTSTRPESHEAIPPTAPKEASSSRETLKTTSDRQFKVNNTMGSSAGSNSGDFHCYRASRQREETRISLMKEKHEHMERQVAFQAKLDHNKTQQERLTQKRAEKRQRKKQLAKERKKNKSSLSTSDARVVHDDGPVTNRGIHTTTVQGISTVVAQQFKNDGSFLEKMKQRDL